MWLLYAFLAPALYAVAEVLDEFLVTKEFRHPWTVVFYTSLFNFIFVPVLFAFSVPELPPLDTVPIFLGLGLVGVGYLYPYYQGLRSDDTSVAVSFFSISRIFIPILAFFIVGEMLDVQQYVGIGLIIISVIALGIHHSRARFRFSKAVWYIGLAAFLLSFESIFLKLLFDRGVSVSTAVGGEALMGLALALCLLLSRSVRTDATKVLPLFIKLSPLFLVEELFTFLGQVTESTAISLTSVSVIKGITISAPFFLVVYAWLGKGMFPKLFKEDLHRKQVLRKLFLFAVLIVGVILVKE